MNEKWLKIGIPARFDYPNPDRSKILGNKTYAAVEQDKLDYLIRSQVIPVMIPPLPRKQLITVMGELDGLLLQGGSDVAPTTYGEQPILDGRWPGDPRRDQLEMEIIGLAMERQLPILGICRGFQILNCYFGGSLYQDLLHQRDDSIPHIQVEHYDRHFHEIELEKGSLLEEIFTSGSAAKINSVHHQGIKDLGKGLRPEAFCKEDGLIEAFSSTETATGRIMAVQWHPEFCRDGDQMQYEADQLLRFWLQQF